MITQGIVFKKKGETAHIKCARPKGCEHCENSAICSKKESEIRAFDPIGVSEGDTVEVETREDAKSILVLFYIFLTPVAILFAVYGLFVINPYLAIAGAVFAAAYFWGLKILDKKFDPKVKIVRIVEKAEDEKQQ
ncbi:MAG: SoxR reducing system RseC family protein [Clostridia bacterium]|nr:SoxR reducing system RseC family protein [Clostridia bacterium]